MSEKYKNKYRIKSARLANWDYRNNGIYFLTICTKDREHFFGDIEKAEMKLNPIGELAHKYWNEIPKHFSFVKLGEFVIMPNHVHGILIIEQNQNFDNVTNSNVVETLQCNVSTRQCNVPTHQCNVPTDKSKKMASISPKPGSISTIIRSYKSVVTKNARKLHADFGWQSRFHDHIVRNKKSFHNISNYIINNPKNWKEDKFHE